MTYVNADALIETEWLAEHMGSTNVKVLDASYHLPGTGRDAETEFSQRHIPGAMLFDIEDVSDRNISLPHMLPTAEQFGAQMSTLGISNEELVVIYDVHGIRTSPRAWWTFRVFGHEKVAVLNGGLPKWLSEHRAVSDEIDDPATHGFPCDREQQAHPRHRSDAEKPGRPPGTRHPTRGLRGGLSASMQSPGPA